MELVAGLFLLIAGAELMVRAAVRLAAGLQVRPLLIGLTIVALGSSAPQLAVSLQAALSGNGDIAVGSVFGSNIFNILVTLGLSALIMPLRVARQLVQLEIPLLIAASLLVFAMTLNQALSRVDGALLLGILCINLWLLLRRAPRPSSRAAASGRPPWLSSLAGIACGLALLGIAGHLLLSAAVEVASALGLSERIIGLTIVAVCTSLPELATSLIAISRKQRDIAVGNVIGSCLFNLLGVLGITALVAPPPLSVSPNALSFDLPIMLGVTLLCWPVFYSGYRVTRVDGLLFLGLYTAYGLHVVAFTTGMPLAGKLEQLMLFFVLPLLVAFLLFSTLRAWWRQRT